VDAFMCYKQKCKVVSLNLAHPVVKYCDYHHQSSDQNICRLSAYDL